MIKPKLMLERLHWEQSEKEGIIKTNNCKTDEDSGSGKTTKDLIVRSQKPGSKHVTIKSKTVQPMKPFHKKKGRKSRIERERLERENLQLKANLQDKKIHRKCKLEAIQKFEELLTEDSIDDMTDPIHDGEKKPNEASVSKNKSRKYSRARAAATRKKVEEETQPDVVRSFKFRCHLCPGGFYTQFELGRHVNGVHMGGRKLKTCCVCLKVFNKRDSLNDHLFAHEKAEVNEEKYNFLQPWTRRDLKSHAFAYCKFCLLSHSTHHSYVTHIREEHTPTPETFQFSCKFDNCPEKFSSIRTMLKHAKDTHAREFYGKFSWMRMTRGIFTGKQVFPRDEFGNYIKKQDRDVTQNAIHAKTVQKTKKRAVKKVKKLQLSKRVKSCTPFQEPLSDEDNEEVYDPSDDDWARKHRSSVRHIPKTLHHARSPPVKIIKLESVQIESEQRVKIEPMINLESPPEPPQPFSLPFSTSFEILADEQVDADASNHTNLTVY
ncbi:Zinc finger protein-likeMSN2 [Orchesella cincta]|uniref:Zinc finger protein-likeMSN2 n=1 Tax=Orchesella cincta TaxID=48709 RepID=A0A1D2MNG1_ORCCI|nr:Zinc finger protein-likeMSN2 [Orchesella cincta]